MKSLVRFAEMSKNEIHTLHEKCSQDIIKICARDHTFSTYIRFSEKLKFLTP